MGVIKYPPKHYNPNSGINSARRKRWEQAEKSKKVINNNNNNTDKNKNSIKK